MHYEPRACEDIPLVERLVIGRKEIVLIGVDYMNREYDAGPRLGGFFPDIDRLAEATTEVLDSDRILLEGRKEPWHESEAEHLEAGKDEGNVLRYPAIDIPATFPDRTRFLEEGVRYRALGTKYGIPEESYPIYDTCRWLDVGAKINLRKAMRNQGYSGLMGEEFERIVHEELSDLIVSRFIEMQKTNPDYTHFMDRQNALREVQRWSEAQRYTGNVMTAVEIGRIFDWYFARARDIDLLGPKIQDALSGKPLKFAVVTRHDHVDFLKRIVEGENFTLEAWPDFIDQFDPNTRGIIRMINQGGHLK